ncbi:isoleucine--tRNA ligase [Rhizophagus irregularis DAOM 181602=DAOM 197198]|nr:isoleucine--tRNA ligase [Rhizophagus irregularis DAOM 181602=DAOM 197198]
MYVNIIQVKFQGCDCHGLSIELKALTELRDVDKSSLMTLQIREVAKVALEALQIQRKEFVRVLMENPYRTLINEYEVKQQNKPIPIHRFPSSRTALAEAELEYLIDSILNSQEKKSLNWIKYQIYIQGKLIGTTYIRPISEKQCSVIDASHITEESGTGLAHQVME